MLRLIDLHRFLLKRSSQRLVDVRGVWPHLTFTLRNNNRTVSISSEKFRKDYRRQLKETFDDAELAIKGINGEITEARRRKLFEAGVSASAVAAAAASGNAGKRLEEFLDRDRRLLNETSGQKRGDVVECRLPESAPVDDEEQGQVQLLAQMFHRCLRGARATAGLVTNEWVWTCEQLECAAQQYLGERLVKARLFSNPKSASIWIRRAGDVDPEIKTPGAFVRKYKFQPFFNGACLIAVFPSAPPSQMRKLWSKVKTLVLDAPHLRILKLALEKVMAERAATHPGLIDFAEIQPNELDRWMSGSPQSSTLRILATCWQSLSPGVRVLVAATVTKIASDPATKMEILRLIHESALRQCCETPLRENCSKRFMKAVDALQAQEAVEWLAWFQPENPLWITMHFQRTDLPDDWVVQWLPALTLAFRDADANPQITQLQETCRNAIIDWRSKHPGAPFPRVAELVRALAPQIQEPLSKLQAYLPHECSGTTFEQNVLGALAGNSAAVQQLLTTLVKPGTAAAPQPEKLAAASNFVNALTELK